LGESFSPNPATGTGSFSVPISLPPGLLTPQVTLSYNGGHGKSEVGSGWHLSRFRIYRTTDKGLPRFNEEDRFAVEGPGINDELVLVNPVRRLYRLKNEGAFALFERDRAADTWTVRFKTGETAVLGETAQSRQQNGNGTYRWWVARQNDRFGHGVHYAYEHDQHQIYLSGITYQVHAANAYQNHVDFIYEPRPDSFTDYTYGYAEGTRKRLSRIEVFHGERRLRTYFLTYLEDELTSLLQSVRLVGEHGLTMPALSFGYAHQGGSAGGLVVMDSPPPLEGLLNGEATLEDLNGDALPDLLIGTAGDYRYYENIDGTTWSEVPQTLQGDPDCNLWEQGVMLLDANGDGFRDVLAPHHNAFRYFPAGRIVDGQLSGFGAPVDLETEGQWSFDWSSAQVEVSDLDHDGRIDLLFQRPGGLTQVLNTKDNLLAESALPDVPIDVDFTDPRVRMFDFNGDSVLDFARIDINYDRASVRVWHGLGWGRYAPEVSMRGVPTGDASEFHLQDINRDGQTDLLRLSGTTASYYLNDGRGGFTGVQAEYWGLVPSYEALKVLFADMNGNGSTDIVWVTTNFEVVYLELLVQPYYGLLSRIDNGMGQVTTITYRTSTDYLVRAKRSGRPWKTPVVQAVPVIAQMRVSDSLDALGLDAADALTVYEYRDGYFDGKEREFRGFAEVSVTEVGDAFEPTKITRTGFHVGRNLQTGADEEILKGKPYRQTVEDESGGLYASTETKWEQRWLCQEDLGGSADQVLPWCSRYGDKQAQKDRLVALGVQTGALSGAWERTQSPRFSFATSEYDAWGNETRKAVYGEVTLSGGHQVGTPFSIEQMDVSAGNDETVSVSRYVNDSLEWLIGLPYEAEIQDLAGAALSHSRIYYDGVDYVGLPLGAANAGKVTRQTAWLDTEDRWIDVARNAYDSHGQLTSTLDANGNLRSLGYDDETHTFLTLERVIVEMGPLDYAAAYDRGTGQIISATDFNGQVTQFDYDGLGRLTKVVDPLGSFDQPLLRYGYTYGTPEYPISTVTTELLVNRFTGTYRTGWSFSDGLGRARLSKVEAEAPHGFVGSGWAQMSRRGQPTHAYDSFASATPDFEPAPPSTAATVQSYDLLGRALETYPPQVGPEATYTKTVYLPWETRVFDERDTSEGTWLYPAVTRVDGQGRVVDILKHNDYDGLFTELHWQVAYDGRGSITSIVDPHGHGRSYSYDSLARRTHIDDPNAGTLDYTYDDTGRLLTRTDAIGQVVENTYGLAGRLHETHLRPSATEPALSSYIYHYDEASPEFPTAQNLRGQLAWIEGPVSSTYSSYDEQGRIVSVLRQIWDPASSDFESQVRDSFQADFLLDPQGKLLGATLPGGLDLAYGYNDRELLESLTASFSGTTAASLAGVLYDAQGKVMQSDRGNGTRRCAGYDRRQRLTSLTAGPSSDTLCDNGTGAFLALRYDYGPAGLISTVTDTSVDVAGIPRLDAAYEYDRLYELVQSTTEHGTTNYSYDAIQNITRVDTDVPYPPFATGDFAYGENGAGPNALTRAGDVTLSYDAAGYARTYRGHELVFDPAGRMIVARDGRGTVIRNYYDAGGERVLKISEQPGEPAAVYRYIFDGYQERRGEPTWILSAGGGPVAEITETAGLVPDLFLLEELSGYLLDPVSQPRPAPQELLDLDGDGDGVFDADDLDVAARRYLGTPAAAAPVRAVRYYYGDHLGGTTHVADALGEVVSHSQYQAYGSLLSQRGVQPVYGFTGAEREPETDLGLMRMGARWYAPAVGRWVSADPLFLQDPESGLKSPLEMALYGYSRNSPTMFVDPSGLGNEASFDILYLYRHDVKRLDIKLPSEKQVAVFVARATGVAAILRCSSEPVVNRWTEWTGERVDDLGDAAFALFEVELAVLGNAAALESFSARGLGALDDAVKVSVETSEELASNEIIVLGSNNKPGNFILRPGVDDVPISGVLDPGKSGSIVVDLDIRAEIPRMFGRAAKRGDTMSGAFVEDITAAGFDVVRAPTPANPNHVRIIAGENGFEGEGLELLSQAFDRLARVKR
jgi:RHS repeat-associated protein